MMDDRTKLLLLLIRNRIALKLIRVRVEPKIAGSCENEPMFQLGWERAFVIVDEILSSIKDDLQEGIEK